MTKIISLLEDDEWKAKKVFRIFEAKQNSSYVYKSNKNYKTKYSGSSNYKNTEVVIKITGATRNFEGLKAHLKYISRRGEVEVISKDGEIFKGVDRLNNLYDTFNDFYKIPTEKFLQDNSIKEKRETLNIVFSMKDRAYAPSKKIKIAAMNTINTIYPNNHFVIAIHNDTDNPHCHLCLKVTDAFGRRINPKKSDLARMRTLFAKELNNLGVEAKATIRNCQDKDIYLKGDFSKPKHKPHHYKVISYGKAHYKFNPEASESFYVRYRTTKGKDIEIWSDDLERVIKENNVKIGDYCRFAITNEEPYEIETKEFVKKNNKKYIQDVKKIVYKRTWDVSIENKAEKELKPLKEFSKSEILEIFNERELHKKYHSEVISYGKQHYKFDIINNMSYYVKLKNSNGSEKVLWNKNLESVIEKNKIRTGDFCYFAVIDEKPQMITIKDKNSNKWYQKTTYDKIWDVSIENKAEKELKPLKDFSKSKYEEVNEPYSTILGFGNTDFSFNQNITQNFYVRLKDVNDKEKIIYGNDLGKLIKDNNLKIGDMCIFDKDKNNKWHLKIKDGSEILEQNLKSLSKYTIIQSKDKNITIEKDIN